MKDLIIAITGKITKSNFVAFEKEALDMIKDADRDLVTDQDFLDAKATVKACTIAKTAINRAKKEAMGQMGDITKLFESLDKIYDQLHKTGRNLNDKVVADFAKNKQVFVNNALEEYRVKYNELVAEIPQIASLIKPNPESYSSCIGKRRVMESIKAAIDANLQEELQSLLMAGEKARASLLMISEVGNDSLFPDTTALLQMSTTELQATIKSRVAEYILQERDKKIQADIDAEEEKLRKAKVLAENDRAILAENDRNIKEVQHPAELFPVPEVKQEVSAPGFIDTHIPAPFSGSDDYTVMNRVQDAVQEEEEEKYSASGPAKEDFVITIPLHCDVEWAKRLAGDILAKIKAYKEVGNMKLSRP